MLPPELREMKPHPDAERLTGLRHDGSLDGRHTGGAFLLGDYVYKPTDAGHPGEDRSLTTEVEVLREMEGQPLFPKNWTLATVTDPATGLERTFIVRKKAPLLGQTILWQDVRTKTALAVEAGVLALNAANWEVNDQLLIGLDRDHHYEPFIVDMSIAQRMGPKPFPADDEFHIMEWLDLAAPRLAKLRKNGRKALLNLVDDTLGPPMDLDEWREAHRYKFCYASFSRPASGTWMNLDTPFRVAHQERSNQTVTPHSWIFTKQQVTPEKLYSYELELAYANPSHTLAADA